MSSSRMSTALKGCRLCKFLLGLIKDGQDDIRWYEATRQRAGYRYRSKLAITNSTGKYHVLLYYIQNDGSLGLVLVPQQQT